jgi:hypothetical protein
MLSSLNTIMAALDLGGDPFKNAILSINKHQSELADTAFSGSALLQDAVDLLCSASENVDKMKNDSDRESALMSVKAAVAKAKEASLQLRNAMTTVDDAASPYAMKLHGTDMHLGEACRSLLFSLQEHSRIVAIIH